MVILAYSFMQIAFPSWQGTIDFPSHLMHVIMNCHMYFRGALGFSIPTGGEAWRPALSHEAFNEVSASLASHTDPLVKPEPSFGTLK